MKKLLAPLVAVLAVVVGLLAMPALASADAQVNFPGTSCYLYSYNPYEGTIPGTGLPTMYSESGIYNCGNISNIDQQIFQLLSNGWQLDQGGTTGWEGWTGSPRWILINVGGACVPNRYYASAAEGYVQLSPNGQDVYEAENTEGTGYKCP